MTHAGPGSARTLLLASFAIAAVVIVVSVAMMTTGGGSSSSDGDEAGGSGLGGPRKKSKAEKSASIDDGEEAGDEEDDGVEWRQPGANSRDPGGSPDYVVDADTLRGAFRVRHWEETRRQIDEMQRAGKTVPEDVVKQLIEMLSKEDLRLDAVLALGGVTDDATGRALAQFATSSEASIEARQAALDALAKSGQKAALPQLQQIVTDAATDERLVRRAVFAVAAVGGPEAWATLKDLLVRHQDVGDDMYGVVMSAIGKASDVDAGMAATLRDAREKGQRSVFQAVVVAAQMQEDRVGAEVKEELKRMVEDPAMFSAFATEEERLQMAGTVLPAAAAVGHVAPVVRIATTPGPLRDTALESLARARGDAAAKQIADALKQATDETVRWKLTKALGNTASFAATPTLVSLLGDSDANVRNVAAQGLGQIRDPSAVPSILKHLEKAAPDYDFAHHLVESLGLIGANSALPALQKLAASEEEFWKKQLGFFIRNAIARIKTENPDSMLLDGK